MESHQVVLLKDVAVLDKLYQLNLNYFKELSMYILAGKRSWRRQKCGASGAFREGTEEWISGGHPGSERFRGNV